jgi:hypothetical protein
MPRGRARFSAKSAQMIKVAVKFCGGCDPAYERVEYLRKIEDAASRRIRWMSLQDDGYEVILLICGCQRACPEEELPGSVRIVSLKSDEADPERVVNMLTGATYR